MTDLEQYVRLLEPLETLGSYRRVGTKIMFGQNLIPRNRGTIRVRDTVRVQ